jgi:hypothetical protein
VWLKRADVSSARVKELQKIGSVVSFGGRLFAGMVRAELATEEGAEEAFGRCEEACYTKKKATQGATEIATK